MKDSLPWILFAAIAGYLLGSLPFGYIVARLRGVDIFAVGSKNPGATNVRRTLGAGAGNTVFALDFLKGMVAAGWPLALCGAAKLPATIGLIFALLGHSFSCFTRFKGGKGVATAGGALLVLLPVATLVAAVVWIAAFYSTRYVSLASILAAVSLAVAVLFSHEPLYLTVAAVAVALFVIVRHRTNMIRLFRGTENKSARRSGGVS